MTDKKIMDKVINEFEEKHPEYVINNDKKEFLLKFIDTLEKMDNDKWTI